MDKLTIPILMSFALVVSACGGGGGGGGGGGTAPQADAGTALEASRNDTVTLDGSASNDPDGDSLTYTWTQTRGLDVTGGVGVLTGASPSFTADSVDTLIFELVVNDGTANSTPDTVMVNVFEDVTSAYFVDGDTGDDTRGTGTRAEPFATLGGALAALTVSQEDIYVKTIAGAYVETAANLNIPSGTSLYGGYDLNWERDVTNKTAVNANYRGVQFFNVTLDAWFSGFDLATGDSPTATDAVFGVFGSGNNTASLYVLDNIIFNGNVAAGVNSTPGSNYGVALRSLATTEVSNNIITAGISGNGANGSTGGAGAKGGNGSGGNLTGGRRAPGGSGGSGANGGSGGQRGGGINGNGGGGAGGVSIVQPLGGTASGGFGGSAGSGNIADGDGGGFIGGSAGRGVPGNAGNGAGSLNSSLFVIANGNTGGRGGHGAGGGGGGGGEANGLGVVGGGGGGGGEGGSGGFGGSGGRGGAASIGIWLHSIATSDILANSILSGSGGSGASGGTGGSGGSRGLGGSGSAGDSNIFGSGGGGGNGGAGGFGGTGGTAGAGGGGPSYGIIFAAGMAPTLTGNTVTSGVAGQGGNGGGRGNGGEGGYSFAIFDRANADGFFAALDSNTLAFGTPGTGGTSGGFDTATAGSNGLSGDRNW